MAYHVTPAEKDAERIQKVFTPRCAAARREGDWERLHHLVCTALAALDSIAAFPQPGAYYAYEQWKIEAESHGAGTLAPPSG